MKNTEKALKWIVGILNKHKVPYQVVGGLAARLYGSKRPLADIDIYIPSQYFKTILPDVRPYITFGPKLYKGESWELVFMALEYAGQQIELSDADNTKIFNKHTSKWEKEKIGFHESEIKDIHGITLNVIPKDRLIAYKRKLLREVDMEDIDQITK